MPIGTTKCGKRFKTLTRSLVLVIALSAATFADTRLVYNSSFGDFSLSPSLDTHDFGTPLPGSTEVAGANPTVTTGDGEVVLSVTRPSDLASGVVVSSGLYITPVRYGPGTILGLQGTFVKPVGPTSGGWAAVLNARTGNERDLPAEIRVNASLNVRPGETARLNVPFGATSQTSADLPPDMYDAIFRHDEPFTLQLLIDRVSGNGTASLKVGDLPPLSKTFQLSQFLANSGPNIEAVGPAVANANAPGQVSVRVRSFRMYEGQRRCPPTQPLC